jgi:hypothetical protein
MWSRNRSIIVPAIVVRLMVILRIPDAAWTVRHAKRGAGLRISKRGEQHQSRQITKTVTFHQSTSRRLGRPRAVLYSLRSRKWTLKKVRPKHCGSGQITFHPKRRSLALSPKDQVASRYSHLLCLKRGNAVGTLAVKRLSESG